MLQLDRIGFVLGESIPFQAEIQNMSKRACTVQMNLIMVSVSTITYVVQTYNGTCRCCTNDYKDLQCMMVSVLMTIKTNNGKCTNDNKDSQW